MDRKKLKGFTLVEVMSVIGIIAVLAGIIIVGISSFQSNARDAKRLSDLRKLKGVLELFAFKNNNNHYPGFNPSDPLRSANTYYWISDNNYAWADSSGWVDNCSQTSGGLKTYIQDICTFKDPQGYPYAYALKLNGTYKLGAKFENSSYRSSGFTWGAAPGPGQKAVTNYFEPKGL